MPDLIILCAGAASDRAEAGRDTRAAADPFGAAGLAASLRSGVLARACRGARVIADTHDDSLLPGELPHEAWLRARHSLPAADSVEAWSAAEYGVPRPCWRMTPVHVRVGHDQLMLCDPLELSLDPVHARALADTVRNTFAQAGLTLRVSTPLAWFASTETPRSWQARAWTLACGRNIIAYLPQGTDAREWRRLFTEVQMLWHEHPVNQEREARGLPAVNALWLDGYAGGSVGIASALPDLILSDDPALLGLTRAAGGRLIGGTFSSFDARALREATCERDIVVDVGAWRAARRTGDVAAWHDAWHMFDHWVAGLYLGARPPRGFDRLRLVLTGERRTVTLELCRGQVRRWLSRLDALACVLTP